MILMVLLASVAVLGGMGFGALLLGAATNPAGGAAQTPTLNDRRHVRIIVGVAALMILVGALSIRSPLCALPFELLVLVGVLCVMFDVPTGAARKRKRKNDEFDLNTDDDTDTDTDADTNDYYVPPPGL